VTEEVSQMTATTAHFASLRADLVVVAQPAQPVFSNGRQIRLDSGVYHQFREHRCQVKGQGHIDFMRSRLRAPDAPEMWELDATDVPEITGLLAELALADVDRVREVLASERSTANRQIVLETCQRVLQRHGVSENATGHKVLAG
jgi:hypothetical protein